MRIVLLVIAGLALVGFIVVAYVLPSMAGTDARDAAQALLAGTAQAEQRVTAAAEKSGKLAGTGAGVSVSEKSDAKYGELKWLVDPDGTIHGWNQKNAIEIALTPKLQGGKVSWSCHGYPNASMPARCRR